MSKNNVNDLITDQERAYAHLILSGTMTDQQAAEAVGLNPTTAAYTKSKPRVQAYMLEHGATMQQQPVEQENGLSRPPRLAVGPAVEGQRRFHVGREQVLDRLWELAILGPEITRGSITGQIKAISIIVAIEGMIPDRRAGSAQKQPAPPPPKPQIYESEWLREQKEKAAGLQAQKEKEPGIPEAEPAPAAPVDAQPAPGPDPGSVLDPAASTFADRFNLLKTQWVPDAGFAPDTRVPFSIQKNRFGRR